MGRLAVALHRVVVNNFIYAICLPTLLTGTMFSSHKAQTNGIDHDSDVRARRPLHSKKPSPDDPSCKFGHHHIGNDLGHFEQYFAHNFLSVWFPAQLFSFQAKTFSGFAIKTT